LEIPEQIRSLVERRRVEWRKHAIKRMLERTISREAVLEALKQCEVVEAYPDDKPLPAFLGLGYHRYQPLHVVVGLDEAEEMLWIITVYEPSLEEWKEDFKTRRRP